MGLRKIDESIFKAYDVRGIYPDQIDEEVALKIGRAYGEVMRPNKEVAVGYDVRIHSKAMAEMVRRGLKESGVNVVDIGLVTTDMMYFAVGQYGLGGGIQVTASHNPPEWHGMKMVAEGVVPLTGDYKIPEITKMVVEDKFGQADQGKERSLEVWEDYCRFILNFTDLQQIKPMKVVINPNFGVAGKVFEKLVEMGKLPIEIVPLNFEPDGTFPKGRPDPFIEQNRGEFVELIKSSGAQMGITWDADADRVFFAGEGGIFMEPYYVNTQLIEEMLEKSPGAAIVYDVRYTWALEETIKKFGGIPALVRVGHSYIKAEMRKQNAIFGAESSGHTYYREFWYADCGMLPPVQLLSLMGRRGKSLAEMVTPVMQRYPISGEINRRVKNVEEVIVNLKRKYKDGQMNELDGLSIEYEDYRFNVRKSNTEPVFRLNLEAKTEEVVKQKTDEILNVIGGETVK